jgi:NAD+ kinase
MLHAAPPPVPWASNPAPPRAYLLGSGDRPNLMAQAQQLRPAIEKNVQIVLEDFQYQKDLSIEPADLAVVLGGDGSILRAALQMQDQQTPILGVNLGKLGFLASVPPADLPKVLPEIVAGECRVVEHIMFRCIVYSDGQQVAETLGLNEVAILTGPPFSLLNADLYVDAELATTYACDGLIVSTPVGSTAHSLSAGGPILHPLLPVAVLTPICPHTLTLRPLVVPDTSVIEVSLETPRESVYLTVDGQEGDEMVFGDRVLVCRHAEQVRLVRTGDPRSIFEGLRSKLHWGE